MGGERSLIRIQTLSPPTKNLALTLACVGHSSFPSKVVVLVFVFFLGGGSKITFTPYLYVCVCASVHLWRCEANCGNLFSPSIIWGLETELRYSGLSVSAVTAEPSCLSLAGLVRVPTAVIKHHEQRKQPGGK